MKLAIDRVMRSHDIEDRALAAAIDPEESAVCRAIRWELDVLNISHLAAKLGFGYRGPQDQPVFVREVHADCVRPLMTEGVHA
jgi:hypothetical protein